MKTLDTKSTEKQNIKKKPELSFQLIDNKLFVLTSYLLIHKHVYHLKPSTEQIWSPVPNQRRQTVCQFALPYNRSPGRLNHTLPWFHNRIHSSLLPLQIRAQGSLTPVTLGESLVMPVMHNPYLPTVPNLQRSLVCTPIHSSAKSWHWHQTQFHFFPLSRFRRWNIVWEPLRKNHTSNWLIHTPFANLKTHTLRIAEWHSHTSSMLKFSYFAPMPKHTRKKEHGNTAVIVTKLRRGTHARCFSSRYIQRRKYQTV